MGFRQADSEGRGGWARIWSAEDKGNYSVCKISTSKKHTNEDGSSYYETDFQDGFVRFIGSAHEKLKTLTITEKGVPIQITSCEVSTPYNPDTKKSFTNYAVFAFNVEESEQSKPAAKGGKKKAATKSTKAKTKAKKTEEVEEEEDDLPF